MRRWKNRINEPRAGWGLSVVRWALSEEQHQRMETLSANNMRTTVCLVAVVAACLTEGVQGGTIHHGYHFGDVGPSNLGAHRDRDGLEAYHIHHHQHAPSQIIEAHAEKKEEDPKPDTALIAHHAEGEAQEQHEDKEADHTGKNYHYDYAVHDLQTHDIKTQWETSDGDTVKGEYTIVEPDGSRRIVQYTADKRSGFHAVVKNIKREDHE